MIGDIEKRLGPQSIQTDDAADRLAHLDPLASMAEHFRHYAVVHGNDTVTFDLSIGVLQLHFPHLLGGIVLRLGNLDTELRTLHRVLRTFHFRIRHRAR